MYIYTSCSRLGSRVKATARVLCNYISRGVHTYRSFRVRVRGWGLRFKLRVRVILHWFLVLK